MEFSVFLLLSEVNNSDTFLRTSLAEAHFSFMCSLSRLLRLSHVLLSELPEELSMRGKSLGHFHDWLLLGKT